MTDSGRGDNTLGGLIGFDIGTVGDSYATGALTSAASDAVGGVVGNDQGTLSDAYWDVTTSGVSQGAGNMTDAPGITGVTSRQLRSGLPYGFAKSAWREKSGLNSGFPWLVANPPPE